MARSLNTVMFRPATAHCPQKGLKDFRQAVRLALLRCECRRKWQVPGVPLGMRRAALALVGQRKPDPDEDKEAADATIEPLFELVAGPEPAADSRRRPGDEQIPNRAVEIEDRA